MSGTDLKVLNSIDSTRSFEISNNELDVLKITISESLTECSELCDFRFNYGNKTNILKVNKTNDNIIKIKPENLELSKITYNSKEYRLEHILVGNTFHLRNNISLNGTDISPHNFSEIFLCHTNLVDDDDKLVVCIIVANDENINKSEVNGKDLSVFFQQINNKEKFSYYLNDLLTTKNGKYNNGFFHYGDAKLIYNITGNPTKIENVLILDDLFYSNRGLNNINSESINILYSGLDDNEYSIAVNYIGTKNSISEQITNDYDLVECQEYTGLEDQIKDNDKLIVNKDKKFEQENEDGYFTYLIKLVNKYIYYILAWLLIIIQILL